MFKERRLIYGFGNSASKPSHDNAPDLADFSKLQLSDIERVPFNLKNLDKFIDDKISRIPLAKIEDFAKKMPTTVKEANRSFCKDVLNVSEKVLGKYSDAQLVVVIKGFQQKLNGIFPKAKLNVDGKMGGKTINNLMAYTSVEHDIESMGGMFTYVESRFSFASNEKLQKCGQMKDWKKVNLFFWNQVLDLDFPNSENINNVSEADQKYIQNKIQNLQKYVSAKLGVKLTADGKIGPKTLAQFAKMIKPEQEKYRKREEAAKKRRNDIAK